MLSSLLQTFLFVLEFRNNTVAFQNRRWHATRPKLAHTNIAGTCVEMKRTVQPPNFAGPCALSGKTCMMCLSNDRSRQSWCWIWSEWSGWLCRLIQPMLMVLCQCHGKLVNVMMPLWPTTLIIHDEVVSFQFVQWVDLVKGKKKIERLIQLEAWGLLQAWPWTAAWRPGLVIKKIEVQGTVVMVQSLVFPFFLFFLNERHSTSAFLLI